jgi:hypothetical protein
MRESSLAVAGGGLGFHVEAPEPLLGPGAEGDGSRRRVDPLAAVGLAQLVA